MCNENPENNFGSVSEMADLNTTADNSKKGNKLNPKSVIFSVLIIFIGVILIKNVFGIQNHSTKKTVTECAETLVLSVSKNPNSVIFNSAEIYDKDKYGKYIVYIDFSGQNSFGGYIRSEWYVLVKDVKSNGEFTYNPSFWHCEAKDLNLNVLKDLNNWDSKE